MSRPIWKGSISFGLVNVPVTLFSMEKSSGELSFKLLDSKDKQPVRYQRVNEKTGEQVPWERIVKGYEVEDGTFVEVTDEDFKNAAVEATQTIAIKDFVPLDSIDQIYYEKPYIVTPVKKSEKGYVLLREALKKSKMAGIAKVVMRTKEYVGALIPVDDALVLEMLRFDHELKKPSEWEVPNGTLRDYQINDKELQLSQQLVEAMSADWKPEQYKDEYYDKLMNWIEEKAAAGKTFQRKIEAEAPERPKASNLVDLTELLRQSIGGGATAAKSERRSDRAASTAPRPSSKRPSPVAKRVLKSNGKKRKAS